MTEDLLGSADSPLGANYFHNLPKDSKPRERLAKEGVDKLNDSELLAILLRTGYKGVDVMRLSERLLQDNHGLHGLVNCAYADLIKQKGIGKAKGAELAAVFEIARRIALPKDYQTIANSEDAADFLNKLLCLETQEKFLVLSLNSKNQLLNVETVFVGTLNSTVVHPREIFKSALKHAAAGIIVAHNHPSGDPTPSREDISATMTIKEAGQVMGIPLLDHLIIGHGRWTSLRANGVIT